MGLFPRDPSVGQIQGTNGGQMDRAFVAHVSEAPVLADVDRLATATATSDSETTEVTTFLAQPDVPRVITVTPGGTTTDVAAGDITITGTDANDQAISENVAILANASTAVTSTKAFKTVTSVLFPIQDGAAATYTIGVGLGIGLLHALKDDCLVLAAMFDGTDELSSATVTVDASVVAKNLYESAGTFDGTKLVEVFYLV